METFVEAYKKDNQDFTLFLEDNRVVQGFFANGRIDRETLPSGWYAYDLGEGETGEICKIANSVEMDLDHYGTFCCKENLWLGKDGLTLAKDEDNTRKGEFEYSFDAYDPEYNFEPPRIIGVDVLEEHDRMKENVLAFTDVDGHGVAFHDFEANDYDKWAEFARKNDLDIQYGKYVHQNTLGLIVGKKIPVNEILSNKELEKAERDVARTFAAFSNLTSKELYGISMGCWDVHENPTKEEIEDMIYYTGISKETQRYMNMDKYRVQNSGSEQKYNNLECISDTNKNFAGVSKTEQTTIKNFLDACSVKASHAVSSPKDFVSSMNSNEDISWALLNAITPRKELKEKIMPEFETIWDNFGKNPKIVKELARKVLDIAQTDDKLKNALEKSIYKRLAINDKVFKDYIKVTKSKQSCR